MKLKYGYSTAVCIPFILFRAKQLSDRVDEEKHRKKLSER